VTPRTTLGRQLGPVGETNWGVASAPLGFSSSKWCLDADEFQHNNNESAMVQPLQRDYERSDGTVNISSLEVMSGLGHGGFGCVVLVADKTTDRKYAMKMISKQIGIGRTIDKLRIEREAVALAMPNSLFLQKCYAEFQSSNNVFFVLEYIEGDSA